MSAHDYFTPSLAPLELINVHWVWGCIATIVVFLFLGYFRSFLFPPNRISRKDEQQSKSPIGSILDDQTSEFVYPKINPSPPFDLNTTSPKSYRPFKWGPNYSITMGLLSASWDEWIEIDNRLQKYHDIKEFRIRTRGDRVVQTLGDQGVAPSGALGAKELMYELAEYLSRRYPSVYSVTRKKPLPGDFGWYGEGEISTITISPLSVTYNLGDEDPMKLSGLLIQDDLAVLLEGSDGKYYLQAASICLAGSWRLEDKIGRPLAEIHTSAGVPQYQERLEQSMDRYFSKLKTDKIVLRNNYFFQVVHDNKQEANPAKPIDQDELSWSYSALGDEDNFGHATQSTETPETTPEDNQCQGPLPSEMFFRSERQSLRRLPRSRAIVFTIHTYMVPIEKLAQEPGAPGRLASAVRSWPEEVAWYKARRTYGDALLKYLDEMHEKQAELGINDPQPPNKYPY